jgi:ferritin
VNKYDNIDFYNIIKNDNPKVIYLYGINKTIKIEDVNILSYIEGKETFIAKKIKKGNIFVRSAKNNFKNELNSLKKIYKFMNRSDNNITFENISQAKRYFIKMKEMYHSRLNEYVMELTFIS